RARRGGARHPDSRPPCPLPCPTPRAHSTPLPAPRVPQLWLAVAQSPPAAPRSSSRSSTPPLSLSGWGRGLGPRGTLVLLLRERHIDQPLAAVAAERLLVLDRPTIVELEHVVARGCPRPVFGLSPLAGGVRHGLEPVARGLRFGRV